MYLRVRMCAKRMQRAFSLLRCSSLSQPFGCKYTSFHINLKGLYQFSDKIEMNNVIFSDKIEMNKLFVIDKTERNTQRYSAVDSRRVAGSYDFLPAFGKWVMSLMMLAGRPSVEDRLHLNNKNKSDFILYCLRFALSLYSENNK